MFRADALFPFNAKMAEHSKEHDLVALQIVDTAFVIHGAPRVRHCRSRSISKRFARELGVVLIKYGTEGRVGYKLRRRSSHLGVYA
jgi:hypothetical protein